MTCLSRVSKAGPTWRYAAASLCALAFMLSPAGAADWPGEAPLRGSFQAPANGPRWDGINFGGHIGVMNLNADFSAVTVPGTAVAAPLPANSTGNGRSYGGFVGYNTHWDDIIIGFDAAYNRMSSAETSTSSTLTIPGVSTVDASSSIKLIEYAALRARAGYAFGQFMPYAMLGAAVGRFDYTNQSTFTDLAFGGPPTVTSVGKNDAYVGGFLGGLGVDVALTPNVFLRAEWEYVGFGKVQGISTGMNTGRVGVGVRF